MGRDLGQTIIVDNSPHSYMFQPENALPIGTFIDDMQDQVRCRGGGGLLDADRRVAKGQWDAGQGAGGSQVAMGGPRKRSGRRVAVPLGRMGGRERWGQSAACG